MTKLANPAVSVTDLTVKFGAFTALNEVSFTARPGEVTGLIGPNGAGKSTLIKALCGRVKPECGVIQIGETPLARGDERRHIIGLVPQDIGLYDHLTGRENLDIFARMNGVARVKRQALVDDVLGSVDMADRCKTRVGDMSGGMKRRINVAAAIMHDPKLLILDEPTAGVDTPSQNAIYSLSRTLARRNMAVLLVTHELNHAETICDNLLVLCRGKLVDHGAPQEILQRQFEGRREVIATLSGTLQAQHITTLKSFGFEPGETTLSFRAETTRPQAEFIADLTSALDGPDIISELTFRKPGLSSLMDTLSCGEVS